MVNEINHYEERLKAQRQEYESLCLRCGACCGAFEVDSCSHLEQDESRKYLCDIYENRLGIQKTKGGRDFMCVPIRSILFKHWLGSWRCAYKKVLWGDVNEIIHRTPLV